MQRKIIRGKDRSDWYASRCESEGQVLTRKASFGDGQLSSEVVSFDSHLSPSTNVTCT